MITMYEDVKILKNGIVGTVVDSYNDKQGKKVYIVESYTVSTDGGYELFDCYDDELQEIDVTKKASGND